MPSTSRQNEPFAIIDSACQFAGGANTRSNLWNLLRNPKDVRTEIPSARFNATEYYHPNSAHHGHSNVKHSYLINDDLSAFDAEEFSINPIEAKAMDPQQRVLLEVVYDFMELARQQIDNL